MPMTGTTSPRPINIQPKWLVEILCDVRIRSKLIRHSSFRSKKFHGIRASDLDYNTPFVLTTSPSLPSTRCIAILQATAKALNALSALWWSLDPLMTSTCSVTFAAWAQLAMPWWIICVFRLPIIGFVNPSSPTKNGRDDMSRTARARASSRGT